MELFSNLNWADWVGIGGSVFIAAAYFGVSSGRMQGDKPPFQLVNLAGAVLILVSLYYRPNAGAILIEILWVLIAIYSLTRYWIAKK